MYLTRERLTQNEKCKFILIKDTSRKCARRFLQVLARSFLNEHSAVKYISYDLPTEIITKEFQFTEPDWHIFDAFTDPVEFNSRNNFFLNPEKLGITSSIGAVVFVDSASTLLYQNSVNSIYKDIHKYINSFPNNNMLVMLMHADSHPQDSVAIIESLATTTLELLPTEGEAYVFRSTVLSSSRKISQEIWQCEITTKAEFGGMTEILPIIASEPMKQPDPTANLTFNLKLTEDEKEVREKLELPYANIQEKKESVPMFTEEDFYDEDDPDDDLDI